MALVAGCGFASASSACTSPNSPTTTGEGPGEATDAGDAAGQSDASLPDSLDSRLDAHAACLAQAVGSHGVGKPCGTGKDCLGQWAVTCLTDLGPGAPSLCTEYCFGFPGECDGSVCMPRGKKAAVCVPAACAARYAVPVPVGITCTEDCAAPPSKFGVGKPCTVHEDCTGQIAKSCPYVFRPDNQKWCTMLCNEDEECGPGAVCWKRKTTEAGVRFTIGSCANAACCWMP